MRLFNHPMTGLVVAGMLLAAFGCGKTETKPQPKKEPPAAAKSVQKPAGKPKPPQVTEETTLAKAIEKAKSEPVPTAIPEVRLTDDMKAASLVKVGDSLPADELDGADGKKVAISNLLGKKATVVLFWDDGDSTTTRLLAVTILQDLQRDIFAPLSAKGVQVVDVNVGDKPEEVSSAVKEAAAEFVTLMDPKGEYFAKIVSKGKVPRVHVLDAAGKVVWFDVEYSRSTRRELLQVMTLLTGGK